MNTINPNRVKTKHTAGPWTANGANIQAPEWGSEFESGLISIAQVRKSIYRATRNEPIKNWQANANLIAAAPEMLEALKLVKEWVNNLFEKGNIPWGQTFGLDFGLMNQTLIAMDKALASVDKTSYEKQPERKLPNEKV